jgi:release factor glutamine methyltransferase
MASYRDVLKEGERRLRASGRESSAAKLLLLHYSGLSATKLYTDFGDEMPDDKKKAFFDALTEHIDRHRPVQYITGETFFYGHRLKIDESALIPRYETEELVLNVLMLLDERFPDRHLDVADVGTGSGCIAVALKKEAPRLRVTATDIEDDALKLAKENARMLDADITFHAGDTLQAIEGKRFDVIVSNPPYIPNEETLERIIVDHEPHAALYGGDDGLDFYRKIVTGAESVLRRPGVLAFEHAYDKKEAMHDLIAGVFPDAEIWTLKDMQGHDRMTFAVIS